MAQGDVVRTRMGRLAVLVHALGPAHFELFVPRGYARSFFEQLRDAAELRG
jgi:sarcosine oxidase gamma subunit